MRELECDLLTKTAMQLVNKNNVLSYISEAYVIYQTKQEQYYGETMLVEPSVSESNHSKKSKRKRSKSSSSGSSFSSDDSCEDIDEESKKSEEEKKEPIKVQVDIPFDKNELIEQLKDSEESWRIFSQYCTDVAASNLNFLMRRN